jgi:hypothetical protein
MCVTTLFLLRESEPELQQTLLIKTVNIHYPSKESNTKERYLSREFLSSPHQCAVSKPVSVMQEEAMQGETQKEGSLHVLQSQPGLHTSAALCCNVTSNRSDVGTFSGN